MKITLDDIARETGLSKSTVSRVVSGKAASCRIPAATVDKVLQAAEQLGYRPDVVGKKLRSSKTATIGLVVPAIANPYFAELSSEIISEAKAYGYTTIITDYKEEESALNSAVTSLLQRKVDGMIVVPSGNNPGFLEKANEKYVPIFLVDRYYEKSSLPYIVSNNYKGGYEATSYLLRNGHRRIACIQGPPDATPNKKRIEGYKAALKDAGIEEEIIVGNEFSIKNGYLEMNLLLHDEEKRPSAVFALSNTICLGVLKAIREAGLKIPEDISLISYDNHVYLDYLETPITRVWQMVDEMGRMSVKLLMDSIQNHRVITSHIELSPELLIRNSVALLSR